MVKWKMQIKNKYVKPKGNTNKHTLICYNLNDQLIFHPNHFGLLNCPWWCRSDNFAIFFSKILLLGFKLNANRMKTFELEFDFFFELSFEFEIAWIAWNKRVHRHTQSLSLSTLFCKQSSSETHTHTLVHTTINVKHC